MRSRKLKTCIAALSAARSRGDLGPEQEQAIDFAILRLKRLGRLKNASTHETYECVAEISEKLVSALYKSKRKF